ncbi:adenosylhomocysteine nucleosidase [Geomicrobium sediminis]|uniref:5'-methylthioadenosine/S-adenosylhomocysteine nucleosidase n=1 Tax=Geomicrobium sediminis TaxID=1347788 RepID=A0ABS2PEN7_9BACL|nr:5'-methylthioadenosine/S-adenosylhomocysteine nucleosidase [Geomicrobium sp. JCM 19055]MBM7633889.1 adenosylhomocysteine nucleosidase [Geomicrobium sediminis]GAJ99055.1 5'-methylthioadenosine nucleosidase [Geomicrobium sp. JCM 19055]GAK06385.1 5'-methylthioadenosine nucleosidase [Geomicrobium sp. JCM 19038]
MKIGIIGAMEEEVRTIAANLENRKEQEIAGCYFYEGNLYGKEVILMQSGIGKVNAAIGTTLMIELYKPDVVVNSGVAGGLDRTMSVGDLVISTEVRYNDVDATVFGYEFGQVPAMPAAYKADEKTHEAVLAAAKKNRIDVKSGLVLSGDSFMNDEERIAMIKEAFPDALCTEMEAGAIAQVAHRFGCPFLIIRALSDIAGDEAIHSYESFLDTTAKISADLVQTIIQDLQ